LKHRGTTSACQRPTFPRPTRGDRRSDVFSRTPMQAWKRTHARARSWGTR
jgi:hypothetical protein